MENIQIKKIIYFGIVFCKITRKVYKTKTEEGIKISGINEKFYLFGFFKVKEIIKIF